MWLYKYFGKVKSTLGIVLHFVDINQANELAAKYKIQALLFQGGQSISSLF
jgi:hypothetical protein